MSIIKKVFKYKETKLSVIKCKDDIWFRGNTIAKILGYAIQRKDKRKLSELVPKFRGSKTESLTNNQKNTTYINESGLYSLILCSKLGICASLQEMGDQRGIAFH